MQSPRTLKEMQSLNGKLAALKRFFSRSAERSLPFFETFKDITKESKDEYRWTENAKKAFQEIKRVIVELPSLTTPTKEETMTLNDTENNYAPLEKLALSLLHMLRRLQRIRSIQHSLRAKKRHKRSGTSQLLVGSSSKNPFRRILLSTGLNAKQECMERWTLFIDGASNSKGFEASLVLINPSGIEFTYSLRLNFTSTNKEAEYEALLTGLRLAKKIKVQDIEVKVDSKLVASQIDESYVGNSTNMIKYLATARECIPEFKSFAIQNIPRNLNQKADILSKLATHAFDHLTKEVLGICPKDKEERRVLRMKINQYILKRDVLFKKGYLVPMLRCVGPLQANYVIREIHMGSCGKHIEAKSVVAKAIRQGYYWLTMHRDARNVTQKCDPCQVHAPVPKHPKTLMTSIMAPWPFYQWGMDILSPLPQSFGKLKFVIVAIDYFRKWIEAKPLARITGKDVKKFTWDNIVWCENLNIKQMNTTVAYPQANGLVERANKSLMKGIKARLGRERAGWVDELPNILWAHRTSLKQSNGKTPFSLTYRSEAVIPMEIGMPTHRTMMIRKEELRLNMDLLQERREAAAIREAKNDASRVEDQGKLGPKWEGPYMVTEAYQNGFYKLQTMGEKEVSRT
ncbi:reverse transcriptase domain-containing protein [Tanacetum coccineum]